MKIKLSILTRIAILFLIALFLASAVVFSFSYGYMLQVAEEQSVEVSRACGTAALTAIGSAENLQALYEDESFREQVRKTFRFICHENNLRYLYLYTVEEDGYRHYIICAADSDEDDDRLETEYGFGSIRMVPLYQAEKTVLDGSREEDHELVDNEFGKVCMYIMPVHDSDGRIIALIGADDNIDDVKRIAGRNLFTLLLLGMIVFALTFGISLLLIRRSVIRPILALSNRMRSFVSDRRENDGEDKRKTIYVDEVTDIENAFEQLTKDINQYVSDIAELTRAQVYTQTQFEVAGKIQSGIVPREYALSEDWGELYGCMVAARTVGGDFYDVFRLDDGHIAIVVGDISDKGISAALFMALVKTSIREKLKAGRGLADTLNLVNQEICGSNPGNMFATVFALIFQPETGIMIYANAGHEAPLLLGTESSFLNIKSGIVLGLFDDSDIVEEKLVLFGGEGILLYTDGITEAINANKQQYGKDRLRETVSDGCRKDIPSCDARALVGSTISSVSAYAGGMEQFDDMTCLAVICKDFEGEKRVLTPDIKSFETVKNIILSSLGENDHTKRIILACEEIFTNIVNYSQADQIVFSSKRSGSIWLITYDDNGIEFDPVKEKRETGEFEDLDQGGMGIIIARRIAKDMIYNRVNNRNVLTMVFDVDAVKSDT